MAKKVRSASLGSKSDRAKLTPSPKPHWTSIDKGLHLGYRKGERAKETSAKRAAGRWVMRRYLGHEKYAVKSVFASLITASL